MADLAEKAMDTPTVPSDVLAPRALPVQKRAKETVKLILETAADLVDEVGLIAFSTNLLAKRAGIRIRTVYRYFPNKLGVLIALVRHLNDDGYENVETFTEFSDPEQDWREVVSAWLEDLTQWMSERPGARLAMTWSYCIPELVAIQEESDEIWTRGLMSAMRARGVDLPPEKLFAVCHSFAASLDAMAEMAATESGDRREDLIDEARRVLFLSLAQHLD